MKLRNAPKWCCVAQHKTHTQGYQNDQTRPGTRFRSFTPNAWAIFHGVGCLAPPSGNLRQLPRLRSSRTSWALKAMRHRPMRPTHRIKESINFRSLDESRIWDDLGGQETFDVFQWCIIRGNDQQTLYSEDSTKWHEVYVKIGIIIQNSESFHPQFFICFNGIKFNSEDASLRIQNSKRLPMQYIFEAKSAEISKHLVTWARHKILDSGDLFVFIMRTKGDNRRPQTQQQLGPMLSHGVRTCWHLTTHQTQQQHETPLHFQVTRSNSFFFANLFWVNSHITQPHEKFHFIKVNLLTTFRRLVATVGFTVWRLKVSWNLAEACGKCPERTRFQNPSLDLENSGNVKISVGHRCHRCHRS